ncbi:MAG: peptide-methionine (R)-S-oxide reductase [Rickettsiaceae bacterium]|jgi:peptide methionine sulfoxide reductase msrA/msrB|nr:peptide-methionine (R)-S-oxide reductase [Rickettsiaceae bacterium]
MIKTSSLTPNEKKIIINKGTEACYTSIIEQTLRDGTYLCRNCGIGLFSARNKFNSGTGWPSFDQGLDNKIKTTKDADNIRIEALCSRCNAHLGGLSVNLRFFRKCLR